VEFAVLGPVAVARDGRDLPLGGRKQRALLAILLLHANEVVSRDRLIDGLWGERPPATAAHTLDNYISRLRKTLGDGRLVRRPPGYLLHVQPAELDLDRFERLLEEGRTELARGDGARAAVALRAALALWRGPALADVLYEPFASSEAERLEERRLVALEGRIDADLALGGGAELVPELEALVREHPHRERLLGQLMLALYRASRQSEALAAFDSARRRLAEELGLQPGPVLAELQRKILAHDPSLGMRRAEQQAGARPTWRPRRRSVAILLAAGTVAVSAAIGIVLGTRGTSASSGSAGSTRLVGLSTGSARSREVSLASAPSAMVADAGSLWLADPGAGTVSRVDLAARTVVDRVPVGGTPGALAAGAGAIWVASVPGESVKRIDPHSGTISQTIALGGARAAALAFGAGRLWVADVTDNSLLAFDPGSGTVQRTLRLGLQPTGLAIGNGALWVGDYGSDLVAEVDLRTGQTIATVHVGNGPSALAVSAGAVWVANSLDSTVARIDPMTGSVVATIPVGSGPDAVAVAGGSVWVANQYSATVSRIDPGRNAVVRSSAVGGGPTALATTGGTLWVAVRPLVQHRGGTLILLHTRPIPIDPALNLDLLPPVSDGLTRDGLLTYNHVSGAAGIQLVPDLAVSVPLPTDGGTTYTFRLRPAIRYSDGRPLRAADFRRAIERLFRLGSDGRPLFTGIRGADRCDQAHCDLARGIVTDESARTVTFHLRAPDPNFLNSLTVGGLASAVPAGTPLHDVGWKPIPGTGPYEIASASKREIRYVRNPRFHEWSHAAQPNGNPDEIDLRFGLSPAQEVRAIEHGRADWMAENPPTNLLPVLQRRFPSQLHSWPSTVTEFFQFNTTVPPFDDIRVRRALNLAIDRRVVARLFGGPETASPTCQILPPGTSGYHRYCPYTRNPRRAGIWTAPDLRRARRLVAASGTQETPITVWGWTDDPALRPQLIRYTANLLRRLGYPTRVHLITHASLAHPPASVFKKIQLIPSEWGDTSYGFFATWFSCAGGSSHGWFCDPRIDRENLRAQSLEATRPQTAASLWAHIDREVVDRAASVPLANRHAIDFVSARARNYEVNPYWGLIADQLQLR
jgi:YVTN family beta-propeller protein